LNPLRSYCTECVLYLKMTYAPTTAKHPLRRTRNSGRTPRGDALGHGMMWETWLEQSGRAGYKRDGRGNSGNERRMAELLRTVRSEKVARMCRADGKPQASEPGNGKQNRTELNDPQIGRRDGGEAWHRKHDGGEKHIRNEPLETSRVKARTY